MREKGAGVLGLGAGAPSLSTKMIVPPVTHFRDLAVWQRGMDVVEAVYRVSCVSPKAEVYGLTAQLRRAVISVPSNIAEGTELSSWNVALR